LKRSCSIVAGSNWTRRVLNEHGLDNVVTVLQGDDLALFHPAPVNKRLGDGLRVFSRGKPDYRKAQGIVLAARQPPAPTSRARDAALRNNPA
jgi:hypothetical protein